MSLILGLALLSAASVVGQSGDRTVVLRGVVHDSLISRAPLAGAEVWVEGTNHTARTDTWGRFEFSAIDAGRYTVTFYHAVLDSLGLSAPATIVDIAAGEPTNVVLATPGPEAAHRSLCPQDPWRATGAVLGMVRDATDGRPLGNVTVTAHWAVYVVAQGPIRSEAREASARTDVSGRVLLCNLPTDVALLLRGQTGEGAAGTLLVDLAGRAFGRADLHLSVALVSGAVTGIVRKRDGSLVAGAMVVAVGTDKRVNTDQFGSFTLPDLIVGSRLVEARALGYAPALTQATVRPGGTERVEIVMGDSIPVLDPVIVEADYRPYLARVGFSQRRNSAQGHFLDTADIDRARARQFEELFRMVPGVRLRPNGSSYLVELQRGEGQILNPALANYCPPSYFIDGVYFPLPPIQTPSVPVVPEEILAIEVYSNIFSAPQQYQRRDGGCGVILIWTKRGLPNRR